MKMFLIIILALGGLLLAVKLAGRLGAQHPAGCARERDLQALLQGQRALEEQGLTLQRRLSALEKSFESLGGELEAAGERPGDDWELMYQKGLAAIMGYSIADACGPKGEV